MIPASEKSVHGVKFVKSNIVIVILLSFSDSAYKDNNFFSLLLSPVFEVKKRFAYLSSALVAAILMATGFNCGAQKLRDNTMPPAVMPFVIVGQDTVFLDVIKPAIISPKATMSKKQWREYYKRVHNFSKAYPYALFISTTINQTDSLFEADNYSRKERDRYLSKMKNDLLKEYEPIFRGLTLKQGLMMIRLIDRDVGQTPYYILRHYLDSPTAGFWQGVARLFGGNLKQPYDKFGEDRDLEDLVGIWEAGYFDELYLTIFGQPRPSIYIPKRFR